MGFAWDLIHSWEIFEKFTFLKYPVILNGNKTIKNVIIESFWQYKARILLFRKLSFNVKTLKNVY